MLEHWEAPFMARAARTHADAQALVMRADRACEHARHVRTRSRRVSRQSAAHDIDPSTEVKLRLALDRSPGR